MGEGKLQTKGLSKAHRRGWRGACGDDNMRDSKGKGKSKGKGNYQV